MKRRRNLHVVALDMRDVQPLTTGMAWVKSSLN